MPGDGDIDEDLLDGHNGNIAWSFFLPGQAQLLTLKTNPTIPVGDPEGVYSKSPPPFFFKYLMKI